MTTITRVVLWHVTHPHLCSDCFEHFHQQTLLLVVSRAAPGTVWKSVTSFVRTADSFTSFRSQLQDLHVCEKFIAGPLSVPLIPSQVLRTL